MRTILGVRSIPLSSDTFEAWTSAGVIFRRRGRSEVWDTDFHEPHIEAVLNMGQLDMDFANVPVPVFNAPITVRSISAAAAIRRTLPDMVPPPTLDGPHWHKVNGYAGNGKVFHKLRGPNCIAMGGDTQKHIEGIEYRVLTVGPLIVQASRKHGTMPDFTYEWIGVEGIKKLGIIPLLKSAVDEIPNGEYSVLGWDIIVNNQQPWIIEANTSPGANKATANRVVDAMKELVK